MSSENYVGIIMAENLRFLGEGSSAQGKFGGYGISTVCASPTPRGLSLAPDLPWADEPSPRNLRFSAIMIPT